MFTLAILLIAWIGSLFFVRRITRPLAALVKATQEIDRGEPNVRVMVQGQDEIAALAASFNHMVAARKNTPGASKNKPWSWSEPTARLWLPVR